MSSDTGAKVRLHKGKWQFQSSRRRGMSSDKHLETLAAAYNAFQSSRRRGMSSDSGEPGLALGLMESFNPLVVEACLRTTMLSDVARCNDQFQSSRRRGMSSDALGRGREVGSGVDSGFNPLVVEACLRTWHVVRPCGRFGLFQSSRRRGMSSDVVTQIAVESATRRFNPLVVEACLRTVTFRGHCDIRT